MINKYAMAPDKNLIFEDELNEFDAAFPIKVKTEPKIIINL